MSSIADIPINQHIGISYDNKSQQLSLADKPFVRNHFSQVSFCAQFTLAESASAQFMHDELGLDLERDIPTLRKAESKFYKPTNGSSICQLISTEHSREQFQDLLNSKGKISTTLKVAVVSEKGVKALVCSFQWLVLRKK